MSNRPAALTAKLESKRLDKGIRQGEIAERLSLSQQTVSIYERFPSRLKAKDAEFAVDFFHAYGFTLEEAHQLARELFADMAQVLSLSGDTIPEKDGGAIPVYAAGTGPAWEDADVLERLFIPGLTGAESGKYIALRAMGESMRPYLDKGDIAIVLCDDGVVAHGDYVAVWLSNDGCVIKRLVTVVEEDLILESLNPGIDEPSVFKAPPGSRVLGKVTQRLLAG